MENGIKYDLTNEYDRSTVCGYHRSPSPLHYGKGAKNSDIVALKKREKQNLIVDGSGDVDSKFTIGFEVEKHSFHRNSVKEYSLFSGFERDGSCGYEAITHILPLLPSGAWRNKIFNMFYEAEEIIDDRFSLSTIECGGHISLGVEGMSGNELMNRLRKFSGVMYALFRRRLSNSFCDRNLFMNASFSSSRYQVCANKRDHIEFRLPSRITSVKQMMRRYELCYVMLDFAVNRPNASFKTFLKAVRPIVKRMYEGDDDKTDIICALAVDFNKMLRIGKINRQVIQFIPSAQRENTLWDRELIRNGW